MAAFSAVHRIAKLSCWRLLHLVYSCTTFCHSIFYSLKCWLYFALFPSSCSTKKLPRHLALLFDSEDVPLHISKVVFLLQQLAQLGLRHISLYDAEGLLKSILPGVLQRNSSVQAYSHFSAGHALNQVDKAELESPLVQSRGRLFVELLSLSDGKKTIVEATRNLCMRTMRSGTFSSDLREKDLDTSLKDMGVVGPDPDLLLLFSNSSCLQGFPPWRLRLTEIQHIGSVQHVSERTLVLTLDEFSHKHHRYGK